MSKQSLTKLHTKDTFLSFEVKGAIGTANALRRALISDVHTCAPSKVVIRCNTSCQTDEYIAHRICMIPFVATNEIDEHLTACVQGRNMTSADLIGPFTTQNPMTVIKLIDDQKVDLDVFFDTGTGEDHAKYSPVAGVAFDAISESKTLIEFESINGEEPALHLQKCLDKILKRLDNVKFQIECQS